MLLGKWTDLAYPQLIYHFLWTLIRSIFGQLLLFVYAETTLNLWIPREENGVRKKTNAN